MIYAGIDVGSRAVKVVLWDNDKMAVLASCVEDQGVDQACISEEVYDGLLGEAGLERSDVANVIATGYGRNAVDFASSTITEITCHAHGVRQLHPEARTVIDIGGQDSKLVRLYEDGRVRDFVMNDRCAAGTGRFLEVVAERLEVGLKDLGAIAETAQEPSAISSMCVVFAETEIIGLLANGEHPENIVAGVQNSIAARIAAMAGRNIDEPVLFTGGVALVPGMEKALESAIEREVTVSRMPQLTGALGAVILAGMEVG